MTKTRLTDYLSRFERFVAFYACSEPERLRCFRFGMQGNAGVWIDLHNDVSNWHELRAGFIGTFGKSAVDYDLIGPKSEVAMSDPVEYVTWNLRWFALICPRASDRDKTWRLFEKLPLELKSFFVRHLPETPSEFVIALRDISRMLQYAMLSGGQLSASTVSCLAHSYSAMKDRSGHEYVYKGNCVVNTPISNLAEYAQAGIKLEGNAHYANQGEAFFAADCYSGVTAYASINAATSRDEGGKNGQLTCVASSMTDELARPSALPILHDGSHQDPKTAVDLDRDKMTAETIAETAGGFSAPADIEDCSGISTKPIQIFWTSDAREDGHGDAGEGRGDDERGPQMSMNVWESVLANEYSDESDSITSERGRVLMSSPTAMTGNELGSEYASDHIPVDVQGNAEMEFLSAVFLLVYVLMQFLVATCCAMTEGARLWMDGLHLDRKLSAQLMPRFSAMCLAMFGYGIQRNSPGTKGVCVQVVAVATQQRWFAALRRRLLRRAKAFAVWKRRRKRKCRRESEDSMLADDKRKRERDDGATFLTISADTAERSLVVFSFLCQMYVL